MDTRTPQPAPAPKQRPIRFTSVEAFAAAYLELHGQAPAPQPEKTSA
jgi:hypothetical protein